MTNKKLNLLKKNIDFKRGLQIESKKKLLKSIIQNKNIKPITRIAVQKKIGNLKNFFQKKQICMLTGSYVNINKRLNVSRFAIKNLILTKNLDNVVNDAW